MTENIAPHARIAAGIPREQLLAVILDALWFQYRERVQYVQQYEAMIATHGGTFVNDHIAFRTIAHQRPFAGIASLARLFEPLGYEPAGCYQFPDKCLSALHFQHPNANFPKLFISELQPWKLSAASQSIIDRYLDQHRPWPDDRVLTRLAAAASDERQTLADAVVTAIEARAWPAPTPDDVAALNRESQYGAWVLVHGYNVNHFTALINSQNAPALDSLEATIAALQAAGVPMKAEIEGAPGSKLRQTATAAVTIPVTMQGPDGPIEQPWSYAYFELAERNPVLDPVTGSLSRFEGFLGAQATHLFEMTRRG